MTHPDLLTPDTVVAHLAARGLIEEGAPTRVRPLSGGISNVVLRVDVPGRAVVVKQALSELRVRERWAFDPRRILAEAECLRVLGGRLVPGQVPELIDVDPAALVIVMSCAPQGGTVWKDALLRGEVDPVIARRTGELLGAIHARSGGDRELAARFDDLMPLIEGRIDPYHRTAARAHPDLAAIIEGDVARLTGRRRALVLGDYSPKNLIVYPSRVLALDFEVAHWGDPAFDAAFLLTHLVAKALHRPSSARELLAAARTFWQAYRTAAGAAGAGEADTARELSVLLLCRADGKSKLEYLDDSRRAELRRLARELLTDPPSRVGDALGRVGRQLAPGAVPA
jgi:tRNA A-37 threonylcarbamoyl transferase component Bud32